MKNVFAKAIEHGSARLSLRQFQYNLERAIIRDENLDPIIREDLGAEDDDLDVNAAFYFTFYFNIIYMLASGHSKEIVYSFMNQYPQPMEEKVICFHIKRVKSNYKEHVELLTAIFKAKINDFMKLGATPEQAMDCLDDWIHDEIA